MQSAKDTFYETLRQRVAALNPSRAVVVRGVTRPGVVVTENELASDTSLLDCFCISWGKMQVDARGDLPMVLQECAIAYETAGTAVNAGMDRGRLLTAMDAELLHVLRADPRYTPKSEYAALQFGGSVKAMTTNVWWGEPVFDDVAVDGARLRRMVTVPVMSYQELEEAGEL